MILHLPAKWRWDTDFPAFSWYSAVSTACYKYIVKAGYQRVYFQGRKDAGNTGPTQIMNMHKFLNRSDKQTLSESWLLTLSKQVSQQKELLSKIYIRVKQNVYVCNICSKICWKRLCDSHWKTVDDVLKNCWNQTYSTALKKRVVFYADLRKNILYYDIHSNMIFTLVIIYDKLE